MGETKKKNEFIRWISSGKVNRRLCIFTFMFVPLLLLVVFTYIPFARMIEFSFYDMKYLSTTRKFVGLDNYISVFKRDDCFRALALCGYYIVASFIQLGLALYLRHPRSGVIWGRTWYCLSVQLCR